MERKPQMTGGKWDDSDGMCNQMEKAAKELIEEILRETLNNQSISLQNYYA